LQTGSITQKRELNYGQNRSIGGNGYAEFSAYATGESSNIGWLISPGIDMDAQDGEVLNFQTEYAYPDTGHYPLEVFVSTDFSGEASGIATATWEPLTVVIAHPDVTSEWFSWVDSGSVDLASYTGNFIYSFSNTQEVIPLTKIQQFTLKMSLYLFHSTNH
jgi:hypothetical protein